MLRTIGLAVVALVAALGLAAGLTSAEPWAYRRGVNVAEYLAYPTGPDWPLFRGPRADISDRELAWLAAAGFTFVRLPVEPTPFVELPAERVALLEERLVAFVRRAQAAGLAVLVTGFPRHDGARWTPSEILARRDGRAFPAYAEFVLRLARLLAAEPAGRVALELMNEPQEVCRRISGPDWTEFQRELYRQVRQAAPSLVLVITGGCWSGRDGLAHLDPEPFDARTLIDVHYYEPFAFTHQSATWTVPELKFLAGLSFPAARTDRAAAVRASTRLFEARGGANRRDLAPTLRRIDAHVRDGAGAGTVRRHLAEIARWADTKKLSRQRILIGEFGAIRPPTPAAMRDDGSRARWLGAVRAMAEANGFGWAVWAYRSEFGLFRDEFGRELDGDMLQALGLKPAPPP